MKGAFGNEGALRFLSGYRRSQLGFPAKEREDFFHKRVGGDAVFFAQRRNVAVLDKLVGPADPHHRCIDHLRMQMFHYRAAETVEQHVIFYGAHDFDAAREKFESAGVHRLDPARINERNGNSFFFELARGFFGNFEHVA